MSDELAELRKISKILVLANAQALETELSKYATTDERKKAWALIDGSRLPDEIAEYSGMKLRTVYDFLKILANADFIKNPHGKPPEKKLEFVPASWLNLIKFEETKEKETGGTNEPDK
jgi:hypothetical protein